AAATGTPQRLPRRLDPHGNDPSLVAGRHVTVAANAEGLVQQTGGHAGFSGSGIVSTQPLMKSACPHFSSQPPDLPDEPEILADPCCQGSSYRQARRQASSLDG